MRLPPALRAFLGVSILCGLLCLGTEAVCGLLLHWGYPYNYPGVLTWISFGDFHAFFGNFAHFHSPEFFHSGPVLPYPAPAVAAFKLWLIPQPRPHHGGAAIARFEGSILLASWALLWMFRRALVRYGLALRAATVFVLGAYVCSFAFWFEFLQGNIEWVICGVLLTGVWAVYRGKYTLAAVCIGVAGSMKLYPIIFVGLFLPLRQYRAVLLTALAAVVTTVVALWLVCPDVALSWHQMLYGLGTFETGYMVKVRPVEVGFDHSLFAVVKLLLTAVAGSHNLQARFGIYMAAVALGGVVLFFGRIRRLPLTNQVLCLGVAAITLPPLSYDYTLIHLYGGLGLLVLYAVQQSRLAPGERPAGLLPALLLLAFILSPESEFFFHGDRFSGQLKCLALLGLGYVSLRYPFPLLAESEEGGLAARRENGVATLPREAQPSVA